MSYSKPPVTLNAVIAVLATLMAGMSVPIDVIQAQIPITQAWRQIAEIEAPAVSPTRGHMTGVLGLNEVKREFGVAYLEKGMFIWVSEEGRRQEIDLIRIRSGRSNYTPTLDLRKGSRYAVGGDTLHLYLVGGSAVFMTNEPEPLDALLADAAGAVKKLVSEINQEGKEEEQKLQRVLDLYRTTPSADSVRQVLGESVRQTGVLANLYRRSGFQGLYFSNSDSLAFNLGEDTSDEQFRHVFAHEYAHIFQRVYGRQIAPLWCGTKATSDPYTYGYGNIIEQQAEATALAFRFLQKTQGGEARTEDLALLEAATPGTNRMVAVFLTHPLFREHPINKGTMPLSGQYKKPIKWAWRDGDEKSLTSEERSENIEAVIVAWNKNACEGRGGKK